MTRTAAQPKESTERPHLCPSCRSDKVSTSNKLQSANAYWRCDQCGHIWNPARAVTPRRRFL